MKILCVGNSFAVDASTHVHQIAKHICKDLEIYVLYIGGCPVERHWKNYQTKEKEYEFYINGERYPTMMCNIFEGLEYTKYDYITFQQVSTKSGDAESFFPDLNLLTSKIKENYQGTHVLHKTWSYAKEFSHEKYGSNPLDQDAMDKDINNAYKEASIRSGIKYIVPSGEAIRLARKVYGDDLNRDGYHLNERGRLLTSIVWVMYFLGLDDLDLTGFVPRGHTYDDVTPGLSPDELPELVKIAREAIKNNKGDNLYE